MTEKEYFKTLLDIHGESTFGVYESSFQEVDGCSKIELRCWGCEAQGMAWGTDRITHFTHEEGCQFLNLKQQIENGK